MHAGALEPTSPERLGSLQSLLSLFSIQCKLIIVLSDTGRAKIESPIIRSRLLSVPDLGTIRLKIYDTYIIATEAGKNGKDRISNTVVHLFCLDFDG